MSDDKSFEDTIRDELDAIAQVNRLRDHLADSLALPHISDMSERDIAEETLQHLRSVGAVLKQFQDVGPAGLMKMMLGKK